MICQECKVDDGATPTNPSPYHPFLFCELIKLGHLDPESYLAGYGFKRAPSPTFDDPPGLRRTDRQRVLGEPS